MSSNKVGLKGLVIATQLMQDKSFVEVTVDLRDGQPPLALPVLVDKAKGLGIGAEVVITVAKVRKQRVSKKAHSKAA